MRVANKRPTFLYLSVLSFYISSMAIAFMPFGSFALGGSRQTAAAVLACMFWAGIIAGIVFTFIFSGQRRWDKRYAYPSRWPAQLTFFSNIPAIVFDSMLIAGTVTIVLSQFLFIFPEWLMWEVIFLTVFSLEMHCIFNGKNYKWLRYKG